ncbi:hypothetical protein CALVIDRAFT_540882 [Calocera viscosa TUFC12733]|uniref:Uncharacterized protein n=1 Tax=Calocera viscosa (strain TUFC12733) TaxID=1330018 RepID=A0A167IG28_CALVF|nr:hypothetical protein CALVIDRAFT_540882 [Calocera viscosa TUFC12733]
MNNFRDYVDDPRLVLQHLPPPLQTAADYLPHVFRWILNYLISPTIYHFQNLGYQLTRLVHTPPSQLQAHDLLFPILSLVLIYFAVTSALRTARYALGMSFWLLKWGTILGVVAVAWAWYSGEPTARGGPSVVGQAWRFVNGEQQREWFATDPEFAWSSWVPEWVWGNGAAGGAWVEVVDGLGAENVRQAAEKWWDEQVNSKPASKGKGKGKQKGKGKEKEGKSSRVR